MVTPVACCLLARAVPAINLFLQRRDFSDFQLNSAIGRFDGRAYEALLETTEVSAMMALPVGLEKPYRLIEG